MRKNLIASALGGVLTISACQPSCNRDSQDEDQQEKSVSDENSVATVNGIDLKKEYLDVLHKNASDKFAKTGRPLNAEIDRKMRGSILRKMIDDELVKQKVEQEGIKIDRFERVEGYEKYKEKIGGQKVFDMFLAREGFSEEQIQKTILSDLQRGKLIEKMNPVEPVTDEQINQHYQANKRLYTLPEMVRARHILLKLDKTEPKEKADLVLKKANQILQEAQAPGSSFDALVQKYSEGPSLKQGGDLGFFARGRMVKEFEDLAFGAPLKKAVGPVKTDFGYHIIFVEEKQPLRVASINEVKNRIVEFMNQHNRSVKSEEIVKSLRKSAKIKIQDYSMTYEEYQDLSERDQLAKADS